MPKVSVVIPTHNRAEYLRSAVASVLEQTYQDFEIVVVDDASRDNTAEVLAGFGAPRIKCIRHEAGKGDGGARNTGIVNARGEYIAFLDDDDQWLPEKLALQVATLDRSPAHVGGVYTGHFDVDESGNQIVKVCHAMRRGNLLEHFFQEASIVTSTLLFRRACFATVGLFDESIPYCSDYDMWIRIAEKYHFECVGQPLVKYRLHANKLSENLPFSIKGRELILSKYQADFCRYPRAYARACRVLGEVYCYAGDVKKGRAAFLKALKTYPLEIRSYCHLCLSLFGARHFRALRETAAKLLAPLRARKVRSEVQKITAQA